MSEEIGIMSDKMGFTWNLYCYENSSALFDIKRGDDMFPERIGSDFYNNIIRKQDSFKMKSQTLSSYTPKTYGDYISTQAEIKFINDIVNMIDKFLYS